MPFSMDFRWNLAAMQYGERWRQSRKLLHAHVHVGASVHHRSTELRAARDLVRDLLATKSEPTALPLLVRRHISGLIMEIAYGIKVGNSEAARKKYIDPAAGILAALGLGGSPGRFLVEHIPARTLHFSSSKKQ
jgi:plasmid stability protein